MLELRYFAWIRERLGVAQESFPSAANDISGLIAELRLRGAPYDHVFAELSGIRVAIDQNVVDLDASLVGAREVAFFPPMTGG